MKVSEIFQPGCDRYRIYGAEYKHVIILNARGYTCTGLIKVGVEKNVYRILNFRH